MISSEGGDVARRPLALMLTADRQIDRRILLEADALEADGWAVRILAMPLDGPDTGRDPRVQRLGINLRRNAREFLILELYRKARAMMPMNSAAMRYMKALAWTYFVDQEQFYVGLFLNEALRHPADLVVAHDLPMLPVAARVAEVKGSKLVYDSHELFSEQEFSDREKRRWRGIEDCYIRLADRVITVNQSIAEELEKRYALPKVHVILNAERPYRAAEPAEQGLRQRLGLGSEAVIGLFQGGMSAGRNLETLVRAMAQVSVSGLHLVFLGDGQMASPLSRLSHDLGLEKRIHFLAAVPQNELLALTASADFGIIAYQPLCLNTRYCTPNKLFEFIAAKLPMVASDLPELNHFVSGYGIGLTGDLSSASSAARMLSSMAADKGGRETFRRRIGEVREFVSWDVEGPKFAALIAGLKPGAGNP